jgi:hypothetical protein
MSLKLLQSLQKPAQASAKQDGARIPEKLIISASVSQLKAVGAGKLSFEDFTKAVQVERVK